MLAWCRHDLIQHLRNVYTLVADPNSYEYSNRVRVDALKREVDAVATRLSKILNMNEERVKEALAVSAYLHDVGKAIGYYQHILQSRCGIDEGRISLKGHELVSMWVAYHVLEDVRPREPFLAGIALHHSARRSLDEAYIGLVRNLVITHNDVDGIVNVLKELNNLSNVKLDLDYIRAWLHQDIDHLIKFKISDYLRGLANENTSKYGELVTYVISIVDDIDSYINRKEFTPIVIRRFIINSSFK